MSEKFEFSVQEHLSGQRLDQIIPGSIPSLSRRKSRKVIDLGGVFVDGKRVKQASRKLRTGQKVKVTVGTTMAVVKNAPEHRVVFEDQQVVVVVKPAGLHSVPTLESDKGNLQWQLAQSRESLWTIQRLDLGTSGLLVFAKTELAEQSLSQQMKERKVNRRYLGLVAGQLTGEFSCDSAIGGKEAFTTIVSRKVIGDVTLIEATLQTGRTHQIRIHCQELGYPILGDKTYGGPSWKFAHHALHAHQLSFDHPSTKKRVEFESPWGLLEKYESLDVIT